MFYETLLDKFGYTTPIFADEILDTFNNFTKAYVYRLLNKEIDKGTIIKYSQGVYFIPEDTILGKTTITARDVVFKKYIYNLIKDEVYGIYSGLSLANEFNLTTQVPNVICITTNNETTRKRIININGMKFILKKSRTIINEDNVYIYKLLTLFTENKLDDFNNESYQIINKYIKENHIQKDDIIEMLKYFPNKTRIRIKESRLFEKQY